jgi:plastin-3
LDKNPINPEDKDLYKRCSDGILICKLINFSVPNTIDERAINKGKSITIYQQLENLELALNSAEAIGCHIVSIRPADIRELKEHLIMGLLWQIIQIGLFAEINLTVHPGLVSLLRDGENKEDLLKLSKEALLLRWFNYHLSRSGYSGKEIKNFSGDIKDSVAYVYLLHQISPKNVSPPITLNALNENDNLRRADKMLQDAERLNVKEFITSKDVIEGNAKLNMAFVANLFNTYPALDAPPNEDNDIEIIEETREEKTYRNWINSLGPYQYTSNQYVNYLYTDLQDCLIIFQLYDMIKPGSVDWSKVIKTFNKIKIKFEILSNCNYAVHLGVKVFEFKLVGIQGSNLQDGDKLHTLALVWQLMRAYTLAILNKIAGQGHPIVENGIIDWANSKVNIFKYLIKKTLST